MLRERVPGAARAPGTADAVRKERTSVCFLRYRLPFTMLACSPSIGTEEEWIGASGIQSGGERSDKLPTKKRHLLFYDSDCGF